jgi:hypothetical protein
MAAVIALVFVLGPGAGRAEAYIDPGTGANLLTSLGLILGVACTGIAIGFTQIKRCCAWCLAKFATRQLEEQPELKSTE